MTGRLSPNRVTKMLERRCEFLRGKIKTREADGVRTEIYADELDSIEQAMDAFVESKTTGRGFLEPVKSAPKGDKPCPFCGSMSLDPYGMEDDADHWVQCTECGAQGPTATLGCRDPDDPEEDGMIDLDAEAVELWNKRAS